MTEMLVFVVVFVVVIDVDETDEAVAVVAVLLLLRWRVFFCGQDLEKWPSCLQCQHCSFRPSTATIIT